MSKLTAHLRTEAGIWTEAKVSVVECRISYMTHLFFNTAVTSNQSSQLGQLANRSFAPLRYLFHGRTVEIWNKIVIYEEKELLQRHWIKTAAAILLLIPGTLLGIIAKLLDYSLFASTRVDYITLQKFDQNPYPLHNNISLQVSHARLDKMATSLKNQMSSKKVWTESPFTSEMSNFMKEAYLEMKMFFDELEERYGKDSGEIAHAMAQDGPEPLSSDDKNIDMYFYYYFYNSLTEIYHLARSCAYLKNHLTKQGCQIIQFPSLTNEDQDPYFTPNTPQYQWRTLYNTFCDKLEQIDGLIEKLNRKDGRFINWSQRDDGLVDEYGFPDTRPTLFLA